jgi:hypothetical protein
LIRSWIDDEERLSLHDEVTVREFYLGNIAARPGTNFDGSHRSEAARVFVPVLNLSLDRLGDSDDGRWQFYRLPLLAPAEKGRHDEKKKSTDEVKQTALDSF